MQYKVYGDYGYISEMLLEEFDSFNEAKRWVDRYCGYGDFGGYDVIEIAKFATDGEYLVEARYDADDYRDETVWIEDDEDIE